MKMMNAALKHWSAPRDRGLIGVFDIMELLMRVSPSQEGIKYNEKKYAKTQLENQHCKRMDRREAKS